eukprot:5430576-Pyramimonas_sp.AAC.1
MPPPELAAGARRRLSERPHLPRTPRTARRARALLEANSGTSRLSSALVGSGRRALPPTGLERASYYDMHSWKTLRVLEGWLRDGTIWWVHLGTPCATRSIARHGPLPPAGAQRAARDVRVTRNL